MTQTEVKPMRQTEALAKAIEMLEQISNGKSFDSLEYLAALTEFKEANRGPEVDVDNEYIVNCLDNANIAHWLGRKVKGADHTLLMKGEDIAQFTTDDDRTKVLTLDWEAVRKGLRIMADKFPRHFHDLVTDNSDAETGDVLVQLAVFGDIIYG